MSKSLDIPAVFFDRDGVINVDYGYISTKERFNLVEGAANALRACRNAGFYVFIVTNQSGIARGYFDEVALKRLHDYMYTLLECQGAVIDDIRFCPHLANATVAAYRRDCDWRKPAPGMILDLAKQWCVDLSRSFLIGDKPSDMAAAAAAGVAGFQFPGGDLLAFIEPILEGRSPDGMRSSHHAS